MRENLLGFLLGALDDSQQEAVAEQLQQNRHLARQCARLEERLEVLKVDRAHYEPPVNLALETIAFVASQAERDEWEQDEPVDTATRATVTRATVTRAAVSPSLSGSEPLSGSSRWTLADIIVAAGICAAAAVLFFPAIASSRQQAALAQCQNNLRQIGVALTQHSEQNGGQFPEVPANGKLAAAGIYAPVLFEDRLLNDPRTMICPSSNLADRRDVYRVPTWAQLEAAEGNQLQMLLREMGGSYGYVFGYVDKDGNYHATHNRRRPTFAVAADAPSLHLAGRQSANHGGCGQNVLYEDGHVQFVSRCRPVDSSDELYLSDRGFVEAGRHWNDSVVADSASRPVIQRASYTP